MRDSFGRKNRFRWRLWLRIAGGAAALWALFDIIRRFH